MCLSERKSGRKLRFLHRSIRLRAFSQSQSSPSNPPSQPQTCRTDPSEVLVSLPQSAFNFSISTRQLACHGTKGLLQTYIGEHDVFIQRMEGNALELHVASAYDPQSPVILECFSDDCIVATPFFRFSVDSVAGRVLALLPNAELLHSVPHCVVFGSPAREAQSVRASFRLPGNAVSDRMRRIALYLAAARRVFARIGVRCGGLCGRYFGGFSV